jgi:hypothetical protein
MVTSHPKIVYCAGDFKCAAASGLEHDPEKVGIGFPSGQTPSVCPEITLK